MSFFQNKGCNGHQLDLTADDQCDKVVDGMNNNYNSWKYQAVMSTPACGAPTSQPSPGGSVTLQSPSTICCP
jgi:hypothetical protein